MRDSTQAHQVTTKARSLRESTNQDIVDNVFINTNLTRAEAAAEYQLRVQRRANAKRRGEHARQDGIVHGDTSRSLQHGTTDDENTGNLLNMAAADFVPSSVSPGTPV